MKTINEYLFNEYVNRNAVSKENAIKALDSAKINKELFYKSLLKFNFLSVDNVYFTLGEIFGIPYRNIASGDLDFNLINQCDFTFMTMNRFIPLKIESNILYVAIDNPLEILSISNIKSIFRKEISLVLTNESNMDSLFAAISNKDNNLESDDEKSINEQNLTVEDDIDAPTIALANKLLESAVEVGASDIHIEPQEETVRIRFRIDGVLKDHTEITKSMYQPLVARYKIISGLDIAERRIPQDGKISLRIKNVDYDFRISTLPILYGEKIVIRIYDIFGAVYTLSSLTTNKADEKKMNYLISNPNGIILLTGPTGSGKTTTLYTMLRALNKPGVNIQTVEDPVENQIKGINQLQVNTKTGLTFSNALRSILRQDPNIIMIGEIRDQETAHIAVQAAITGHLVLSTIHTNNAATTISRLIDMGIEPYLVSDALKGAISQRLVRVLCPKCKKEHTLTEYEAKLLGAPLNTKIYEPCGCSYCNKTGYKGRKAVFEIMVVGDNIKQSISKKMYSEQTLIEPAKKDGLVQLKQKLSEIVLDGTTSFEEFTSLTTEEVQ